MIGGGFGDGRELESIESGGGVEEHLSCESGIDDSLDAIDGDGGLGNVGGEYDFALWGRCEDEILIFGGHVAVEGEQGEGEAAGSGLESFGGAMDFCDTWEEDEDVSGGFSQCGFSAICSGIGYWATVRFVEVVNGDRELAALALENGAVIKKAGNGRGVEGGGHDHDFEVGADGMADASDHGECEVAVESSFVEFVEDDGADIFEEWVILEFAEEDAFGDDEDLGAGGEGFFKADLEANGFTGVFVSFRGHASGGGAGGDAAGFEEEDLLCASDAGVENGGRNAGGLAGAWRGDEDGAAGVFEGGDEMWEDFVNGKYFGHPGLSGWFGLEWRAGGVDRRVCPSCGRGGFSTKNRPQASHYWLSGAV
ncbi:MAG: hypothetical protein RL215_548 [Planctomycetota bacterium]